MSTSPPSSGSPYIISSASSPTLPTTISLPSSPSPSTASLSSPPSSYAVLPNMLSVVYPSGTMYVAAGQQQQQQQYYYVQSQPVSTAAGQWATAIPVVQPNGTGYYYAVQRPQAQAQAMPPTVYAVNPAQQQRPTATSIAGPRPMSTIQSSPIQTSPLQAATLQPQVIPQAAMQVAPPVKSQPLPIMYPGVGPGAVVPVRPALHRKASSISMRRGSFDEGIPVEPEDFLPASPVLSDTTISSSSSGSSVGSHLNLSRSAMSHYTAPQRAGRRQSIIRSSSYDLPVPVPVPARNSVAFQSPPQMQPLYPQQTGAPPQMASEPFGHAPAHSRSLGPSARPVSFHEDQDPVYSSYELYQSAPLRSHPPTTRPVLTRRASSRSISGGSYGTGLGMAAPGAFGMGYGSRDDLDTKRSWWKGGR